MSGHKNTGILISLYWQSACFRFFTAVLMTSHYNRAQFQLLHHLPEYHRRTAGSETDPAILKDYKNKTAVPEERIPAAYGYRQSDFSKAAPNYGIIFAAAGFLLARHCFWPPSGICVEKKCCGLSL